ncbi:HigA family addiction module antitoxin [Burkholderia vietnamiensis]|uniref:HigA family addiction module antitoxin n=1 Tax=Burkholderia vietnamiensis TaxID=60552 RepID=UPI002652507C|nr:HigA family addiction module antitoxin [Burkholderia vietnamiensis]MDN7820883.1 HigA family addiction module antitoxin [Burkholderia vietnamiensis]
MITMHPGEYLQLAYMEPLGLQQVDVAKRLDISPSTLSRLISGSIELTAPMAVRLSIVFGRSPESWLAMQASHSLVSAREEIDAAKLMPVNYEPVANKVELA